MATQSYNSHTGKWVVREGRKITGNYDEKQPGIEVSGKTKPKKEDQEPEQTEVIMIEESLEEIMENDKKETEKRINPFIIPWWER